MEPRDLQVDTMAAIINAKQKPCICSNHPGGVIVAMVNGSIKFIDETRIANEIQALLTIDGGEPTPEW